MAKRKRPEGVSDKEMELHLQKDFISNHATRSEKTAWQRQHDNLTALVRKLAPIEDKLLSLTTDKAKIMDELFVLRKELVDQCIHPFDHLIKHNDCIVCKFCEKRMAIPNGESTEDHEHDEAEESNKDS